jgi:hypothetical protein
MLSSVFRKPVYWPDLFCTESSVCSSLLAPEKPLAIPVYSSAEKRLGTGRIRPTSRTRVVHVRQRPDCSLSVSGIKASRPQTSATTAPPSRVSLPPLAPAVRPATEATPVRRQLVLSPRASTSLRVVQVRTPLHPGLVRIVSPTVVQDRTVRHLLVGPFLHV